MKIKCPMFFQDEVLDAKLVKMPSMLSRGETRTVLEIIGKFLQIDPPAEKCIIISATKEEINSLEEAGYKLDIQK